MGVLFDLKSSSAGQALVQNTRIDEVCADLQATLDEGQMGSKLALRLRGRMQFAEAKVFGTTGRA